MNKLISLCTPCMNRTHDLKEVMPSRLDAAAVSPPVEICIVDYGSTDGLWEYFCTLEAPDGVRLTYCRYAARHWHMAHAYNLAITSSQGQYFWLMGADVSLRIDAIMHIRSLLAEGYVWMHPARRYRGIIVCRRDEFLAAGGYDERFELYGPEDKELELRLHRRGGKMATYPPHLLSVIRTTDAEKVRNYRLPMARYQMSERMMAHYQDNAENHVLVANRGKVWAQWT